jgi:hypothetical protein
MSSWASEIFRSTLCCSRMLNKVAFILRLAGSRGIWVFLLLCDLIYEYIISVCVCVCVCFMSCVLGCRYEFLYCLLLLFFLFCCILHYYLWACCLYVLCFIVL